MKIILAQPRGFCAGVVRAIDIVEGALEKHGWPVYVRHEIVHNGQVVAELKARGARFVQNLAEVPRGAPTVFSAHGVSRAVERQARARNLTVFDATCPLVAKVHAHAARYADEGRTLLFIGHAGHPEVEGTLGRIDGPVHLVQSIADVATLALAEDTPLAYLTQTTLSVDDTKAIIEAIETRFSDVVGPETKDICYATQNRQTAVRALSRLVDVILVVGARNRPNSNRLREIGAQAGVPSYLLAGKDELDLDLLRGAKTIGLTAGASAPEVLVEEIIEALRGLGPVDVAVLPGVQEIVEFRLPFEFLASSA
jgi:4-hydroxy-3-methylbut-2-en-1-yl diphosphate reductase